MKNTSPRLYFTLDGVPSHTPAWQIRNTLELLKPAVTRGADPTIIPGANGVIAHPLYDDGTERVMTGKVFGQYDRNGDRHPSEIEGLAINLAYLANAWRAIPGTTDSTRPLVLHLPDGSTMTGDVQVRDFDYDDADMPVAANLVVRLYLPKGALT